MTAQERQQLSDLLEKAIRGDEQAISEVCEFIDKHKREETMHRLLHTGVVNSLDEAYQEVLLTLQHKLCHLKVVDAFESWLWRLEMSVAKKYRPRYARYARSIRVESQASGQPREIGARAIVVAGKPQIARIFEPALPQEEPSQRRPLFEPVTDGILAKASMPNRPNYPTSIDVWRAMASLPKRWARAMFLMHVEERTAAEAGEILGCSEDRVYRLIQNAKDRLRLLLVPYARNGSTESVLRSYKSRQAAAALKRAIPFSNLPPRRCWVLIQLRMRGSSPSVQSK